MKVEYNDTGSRRVVFEDGTLPSHWEAYQHPIIFPFKGQFYITFSEYWLGTPGIRADEFYRLERVK